MSHPEPTRYVCIHGHFYQPPRENPWLEVIEREESAAPSHDWNERIHLECYRANAAARLVNDHNQVLSLHNNYEHLSFNFGPTLIRWIEEHDPMTYRAILDADRGSAKRLGGHGNAIAQAYNHMILPLANRRDKVTQVLWGIKDFESRFGRTPEGMWLAETAVDRESLTIMAEAGIKFTILSPFQAARWRFQEGKGAWQDASGGTIPTGRAYRYDCGGGKSIAIFFYDGAIAKGIAFERLLEHSSKLVDRIHSAFDARQAASPEEPWLIHTATDGESYGHHFKFGDMALAAAYEQLGADPRVRIINYGAFLKTFPVRAEVEIIENSAWSCAHGVGRWERDCGCRIGGGDGWNQKWRGPLRKGLNGLRDSLSLHYEREMGKLTRFPWKVRDAYIEVVLGSGNGGKEAFFKRFALKGITAEHIQRFYQLLEMERCSMLMFTSCGWFFDEISNLESVLLMRYALRAMQLAEQTGAPPLEPALLAILREAPSNLPEFGDGARVYEAKVRPEVVGKDRVAASYAILSLALSSRRTYTISPFQIVPEQEEDLGSNPVPCHFGHIRVVDERTLDETGFIYAVLHFGGLDFRCSVRPSVSAGEYDSILATLEQAVEEQNTIRMNRIIDETLGTTAFSLHDVFKDLRYSIALEISRRSLATFTDLQRHLYQIYSPLMVSLSQWGIKIPADLRSSIKRVLSDEVGQLVTDILDHEGEQDSNGLPWETTDFFYRAHLGRLHSLLSDAGSWGVSLGFTMVNSDLGGALVDTLSQLCESFQSGLAGRFLRLMGICRILGIRPRFWELQTIYYRFINRLLKTPSAAQKIGNIDGLLMELDGALECLFHRLWESGRKALSPREKRPLPVVVKKR